MHGFKIKAISQSVRCDICHKADLFDPKTGQCSRCAVIKPPHKSISPTGKISLTALMSGLGGASVFYWVKRLTRPPVLKSFMLVQIQEPAFDEFIFQYLIPAGIIIGVVLYHIYMKSES